MIDNTGTISGNTTVTGNGDFNNNAGGTLTGTLSVSGGAFDNTTATSAVNGATTITAGTVTNSGGSFAAVDNSGSGTFTNASGSAGAVTNAATASNAGTIASLSNTAGTFGNTGTVTNATAITGGTVTSSGTLGGAVTVATGATLAVNGGTNGSTTTNNGGTININGGTFTGLITNTSGTLTSMGVVAANGGLQNDANATIAGTLTGNVANSGSLSNTGTISGNFGNSGTLVLNGGTITGNYTKTGTGNLIATASGTVGSMTGPVTIDMTGAGTTQAVTVGSLTGTDTVDILANYDLRPSIGTADKITVTGSATAPLRFTFSDAVSGSHLNTFLGGPITVLDGQDSSYNFTYSGLPAGGAVVYTLEQSNTNDLAIISQTSAGIGGIAANASLVQSLIGTVVNRPSSPFTGGLASETGCSQGGFARYTYGKANVSGKTSNGISTQQNSASADYQGLQAGWDVGCNDGRFFDGWDGTFGVTLGFNNGTTNQNVYVANTTTLSSITNTKFDQKYIGAYGALSKDRLTADVQLRFEQTNFKLNETTFGGSSGLGLSNSKFKTDSVNVIGRVSYRMDINDKGVNFVPTAGLSVSHTSSGDLALTGGEKLHLNGFNSAVGFVGGTIAKTIINQAGDAGTTYFASGNYYNDFTGARTALFTDALLNTQSLSTENIGGFAEVSLGVNYVKILDGNSLGGAKQLNANIRADTRFGKNVKKSNSITAQVRLAF